MSRGDSLLVTLNSDGLPHELANNTWRVGGVGGGQELGETISSPSVVSNAAWGTDPALQGGASQSEKEEPGDDESSDVQTYVKAVFDRQQARQVAAVGEMQIVVRPP